MFGILVIPPIFQFQYRVKKMIKTFFAPIMNFLVTIIILLCISNSITAEEVVRLTNGEYAPYQSEKLKYYGVNSRIVTEAFALEGVKVKYGFFPWKRAMLFVETGEWDGSPGWFYSKERAKHSYLSDAFIKYEFVFFHLKSYSFDWKNIGDLKGISIGATAEYNMGKTFQDAEKTGKIKVKRVTRDIQNLRRLLAGHIKLYATELDATYFLMQKELTSAEKKLITHHPKTLRADPAYLLLSKKIPRNKRLIEVFNKGLKQLKESGKLDQYIEESRRGEYIIK